MESTQRTQPNTLLRRQRLLRGWSLQHVVEQLCLLCQEDEDIPGVTAGMVSKWERGERKPSRFYQTKLCLLYDTTADQLGLLDAPDTHEAPHRDGYRAASSISSFTPSPSASTKAIDALLNQEQGEASETLAAYLLSLSGKQLATLTILGWTQKDILKALQIVLQGETAMANMNRRQFIHLGTGLLLLSGIDLPTREHPSLEERTQLMKTLGEGIAASWALFHVSGPEQVLAVSRTQLDLVQQNHANIYPIVLSMCYSGVYRLIGAAFHFQGRYDEAHKAHEKAYIAALEYADTWNMAQSRSWQAYGWRGSGNYADALQTTDAALRLISGERTIESIRLRARLLALAAENVALMGDMHETEARLRASEQ
jgi:transcriptional regulator with XRE-family HTH domain